MGHFTVDELTARLDAFFSGRLTRPLVIANPKLDSERVSAAQSSVDGEPRLQGHLLVASSGTTAAAPGEDKWVALSRSALLASAHAVNAFLDSDPSDVWLNPLPAFHVGGLGIWTRARLSGADVIPLPKWEAKAFVDTALASRATLSSLVPTQLFDLIKAGCAAPRTLRAVIVGGGALDAALKSHALELGWPVLESYGMSETASQVATARTPEERTLTPLPHARLDVDADGMLIVCESRALLTAYVHVGPSGHRFDDPKVNGAFRTSDLAERSADGKLRILGRRSAFVKVLGENVDLARLTRLAERLAREIGLADGAVTALPDARAGAQVALAFAGAETLGADFLDRFNTLVLPYERASRAVALPSIPRTDLGKVAETRLQDAVTEATDAK
jgi:O-succinylbenzoic acid--CoA ligase